MKRIAVVMVGAALLAAAFAAWGGAARSDAPSARGADGVGPTAKPKPRLPRLPADVRNRKRWKIGVKCDSPPFGFTNVRGRNAGYDVEIGRWFAQFAFGRRDRVDFECVTTQSRITALQAKRIDIAIATITYFPERAEVIDYSIPYFAATGRLLIRKGTNVRLSNLSGKTVSTTSGSVYDAWLNKCYKNTRALLLTGTSANVLALKEGRADAFMFDDAFLLDYVLRDPDVRVTQDKFLRIPWGIGIQKGNRAMKRWVDSRLRILQRKNEFLKILRRNAPPALLDDFAAYVPRPGKSLKYPAGKTRDEILPCR